jgi:GMP synthase (glutamine-hydrolysing)
MKPIAILNNGPIRSMEGAFYAACGGDLDMLFATAAGLPMSSVVNIDVQAGDDFPAADEVAAVILSGSAEMITDRHAWAEAEADWVRRNRGKVPMLGVCFGHQLLTHALGGEVDWTPSGPEYGTVSIRPLAAARQDPLLGGLPTPFPAQSAHAQCALRLPADAQLLAEGDSGIQAARFDESIWGLQFHPEFTAAMMRGLFTAYGDSYRRKGMDVDGLTAGLSDTPRAMSVVREFLALCGVAAQRRAAE